MIIDHAMINCWSCMIIVDHAMINCWSYAMIIDHCHERLLIIHDQHWSVYHIVTTTTETGHVVRMTSKWGPKCLERSIKQPGPKSKIPFGDNVGPFWHHSLKWNWTTNIHNTISQRTKLKERKKQKQKWRKTLQWIILTEQKNTAKSWYDTRHGKLHETGETSFCLWIQGSPFNRD